MTRRRHTGRVRALVLAFAWLLSCAASAQAAPGPLLLTPATDLAASLNCTPDLASSDRTPVLLVHGTGATPSDDFGWNYLKLLPAAGVPTCTVTIPNRALRDVQGNVEYVVFAIREMARVSGRKISIIGHSQGAFLPTYALRFWPDLARKVDDFIGYAGTYTYGTDVSNAICGTPATCVTAFTQFRPGSRFLRSVAAAPLPEGPSYTGFTTSTDEIVTPQPTASVLEAPGARTYNLQDLCPADPAEHLLIIGERPMYALTLDALGHAGPADLARLGTAGCGLLPGVAESAPALASFATGIAAETPGAASPDMTEPALRCYLDASCVQPRLAPVLTARTTPRRIKDRRKRLRYTTRGTVSLPSGTTERCGGRVTIRIRRARRTVRGTSAALIPNRHPTGPDCSYRTTITLPRSTRAGRLRVVVDLPGTPRFAPARAPIQRIRAHR